MADDSWGLHPYEVDMLEIFCNSDVPLTGFVLAQKLHDAKKPTTKSAIAKRLGIMEERGLVAREEPATEPLSPINVPYALTVLGAISLSEVTASIEPQLSVVEEPAPAIPPIPDNIILGYN